MAKTKRVKKQPPSEAEILSEAIQGYKLALIIRANFPKYDDRKRRFLITVAQALELITPDDMDRIEPILFRTLGAHNMKTICDAVRGEFNALF